jgi:hypothetical protein
MLPNRVRKLRRPPLAPAPSAYPNAVPVASVRGSARTSALVSHGASLGSHLASCCRPRSKGAPQKEYAMKYGLFWLLGIPLPVLLIVYLIFHH